MWGEADPVLLIFVVPLLSSRSTERSIGCFTDKVPNDLGAAPLDRILRSKNCLQTTPPPSVHWKQSVLRIRQSNGNVEHAIPAWVRRDVLYLLVDYLERAFRSLLSTIR